MSADEMTVPVPPSFEATDSILTPVATPMERIVKLPDLTFWTEERVERAKKLFNEGQSYTQIGIALGTTRNAICGKLVRAGVYRVGKRIEGARTYSKRPLGYKSRRQLVSAARKQAQERYEQGSREPWVRPEMPSLDPATAVNFDNLRDHHCRWPHGENGETLYCGAERLSKLLPYCAPHCQIAYEAPKRRR